MENRYQNAKIYRIVCNVTGLQYIGSTCLPTLAKRLAYHRSDYNRYLDGKCHFVTSFDILKNNNYEIILIEECKCETKDQLLARERYHIENNNCINKVIPNRTKKEYYEQNKEQILNYQNQYNKQNKDKLKQQFTCECGGKYTHSGKSQHLKTAKHKNYLNNQKDNI